MATVASALKSGAKTLAEPLFTVGLKAVLDVPVEGAVQWVKSRFHDHSGTLSKAIAAANQKAWQAVGLALAGDSLLGRITGLSHDGDLKAAQAQIRAFVTDADTGLDGQPAGLRAQACDQLNRLQRAGRLGVEVQLESLDLTRFASTATVAEDAHRAIHLIADDLTAEYPDLARALTLTPPGGGTPLLAAVFAYFLRRQIATHPELARELTYDGLRLLSVRQQAGFANLDQALAGRFDTLFENLGGWFATTDATLDSQSAKLDQVIQMLRVVTEARKPLTVTVQSEDQKRLVKEILAQLSALPPELLGSGILSRMGDVLAAAGQFEEAAKAQAAAADAAKQSADRTAEAVAAYKQFKTLCEVRRWDEAMAAMNRAITLDGKRFRPVPNHYLIDGILGAGAFGVVLKCRDTHETDDDGDFAVFAVKTFRMSDVDRPPEEVFAEASLLRKMSHPNVIGIHERSFVDPSSGDRPYLAMEFFPGETLEDWLSRNGRMSLPDFVAVFGQIAAGLHAAHTLRRPIIHRDVKPANVMVRRVNGVWEVKVIDFGLAVKSDVRTTSQNVPPQMRSTRDRSVTGTIKFAAPEQLGERPYPVGPWSDVYAFGKTALEAILGTVQPTLEDWEVLPKALAGILGRCVSETYIPEDPTRRRFHGFEPILTALRTGEWHHQIPPISSPSPEPTTHLTQTTTLPASMAPETEVAGRAVVVYKARPRKPKPAAEPDLFATLESNLDSSQSDSIDDESDPSPHVGQRGLVDISKLGTAQSVAASEDPSFPENGHELPEPRSLYDEAEDGSVTAMMALGEMHEKGDGMFVDIGEAMYWYRAASKLGSVAAKKRLAYWLLHRPNRTPRYESAFGLYHEAALLGDAEAMWHVANCYSSGLGVELSIHEAVRWLFGAAQQGHLESMKCFVRICQQGLGANPDPVKALRWIEMCASQGDPESIFNLGILLQDHELILQAAQSGWPEAMLEAAEVALAQQNGPASREQAILWLRKAAECGFTEAQAKLAELSLIPSVMYKTESQQSC